MQRSPSRRALFAALALALAGVGVSCLLLVRAWSGGPDIDAGDFGADPGSGTIFSGPPAALEPPPSDSTREAAPTAPDAVPRPVTLSLTRLGIHAPVDPVGVSADGQVTVPADPGRVGWYRYSPPPGSSTGSSVIVGHVDSAGRGLGVLVALRDLRQGDRVEVERADGSDVDYRVISRRTLGKRALARSDTFRTDGQAVLSLVTCTGPYLPEEGGYQNNLVVTAAEVPK
ncbi:class F sortase [Streptomyces sp. NPDC060011]|uniref:class F sortase n=1 Tax=unclassified Streptomyces TaxID=2593676 RepID=UPI00225BA25F|nr:class F sortase [Streptomyces sp. NBC_00340]MCX5137445.1 class F sortase [Streptomyces sp. NBC_00340]